MNIIIVGCGRVGSQLAVLLSNNGHNVCVVDKNPASFAKLGRDFNGRVIKGLGFDEDTLLAAGVDVCDVLAAVTNLDNSNLMTAEVARKIFHVPHVITRLYAPERETAYLQLGLDYVCGTTLVAEEMFAKIQSEHGHHVDTFGDYEVVRFSLELPGEEYNSIYVENLERSHEVRIIVFEHNGETSIPGPGSTLHNGDVVMAAVSHDRMNDFSRYMKS